MDALRTAVSAWGATQDLPWPPTVEQARALTSFSPSALAAFARLRDGPGADRPRSRRSTSSTGFLYQLTGDAAGRRHGPRARRLLHRRRRALVQRLDVHRAGHHLDPLGHRLGGRRRDRHDEGAAPRRRAVRGRRPAQPGRLGRAGRGVGPRRARPRRAADGLRPPRLPGLRPAGGRAARGRRVDGAQARLAGPRDRGRGRRPARAGREAPGPAAQDQRRVLRRAGADGRRPHAGPVPGRRSRCRATPAGPRTRSSRRPTTGSSARTSTTSAPRSATSPAEHRPTARLSWRATGSV